MSYSCDGKISKVVPHMSDVHCRLPDSGYLAKGDDAHV